MEEEPGDLDAKLDRLLIQYRKAPNSTTNQSPSELMFGRQIRTRLDLLKRNLTVEKNEQAPNEPVTREFEAGEKVQVRSYRNHREKWSFGTVFARIGLAQYEVIVDGAHRKYHVNQMRPTSYSVNDKDQYKQPQEDAAPIISPTLSRPTPILINTEAEADLNHTDDSTLLNSSAQQSPVAQSTPWSHHTSGRQSQDTDWQPSSDESTIIATPATTPRRTTRQRRIPVRLDL